ncbi:MAG: beta-1,3-glucanase family protein [Holophaga sp.]
MPKSFPPLLALLFSGLTFLACGGGRRDAAAPPEAAARPRPLAPAPPPVRFAFTDASQGSGPREPVFAVLTGRDASGRFCRLDAAGRFRPCSPADNVIPRGGTTWCDYAIPLRDVPALDLDPALRIASGRLYLSAGAPLWIRVDEATGELVQPDPANPSDSNQDLRYDWIEFTLDDAGFFGNTTCVDQFGLPIALAVTRRADPGHPVGPVGLTESRSALFAAYRREVPATFAALADPGERRILAPARGAFGSAGPDRDYLRDYIDRMWAKYRAEPLVLTPDVGTFTGIVAPDDQLVFTREGDTGAWVIAGEPTTQEVFLCNGVLAQGSGTEKVLGAQLAALLNRHALETPLRWRDPGAYYGADPCNRYAWFWHRHGVGRRAYGFAYDDVNDQSSSLAVPDPLEIRISWRLD